MTRRARGESLTAAGPAWPCQYQAYRGLPARRGRRHAREHDFRSFPPAAGRQVPAGRALWLEQAAGRDATGAGLLMTPSFVVAAAVSAAAARLRRLRPQLLAGAGALVAVSAGQLVLQARSPLWLLIALSVVFGFQNGINVVANQAAMYAQAPAAATGTAAGLLRTFMYLGAIASASLISACYGRQATDAGLHRLGLFLTGASVALLAATLLAPAGAARPGRSLGACSEP